MINLLIFFFNSCILSDKYADLLKKSILTQIKTYF